MAKKNLPFTLAWMLSAALAASGCSSSPTRSDAGAPSVASAATAGRVGPGMNAHGEVINSAQVEAGYGRPVKGLGDWEGEITGKPAANSGFTKLQIGMSTKQVTDLIGPPDDQGAYVTGKAFIPFYFGSDQHRYEFVYKGQGRLIFAGGAVGDFFSGHLVWIIHNAKEGAYR